MLGFDKRAGMVGVLGAIAAGGLWMGCAADPAGTDDRMMGVGAAASGASQAGTSGTSSPGGSGSGGSSSQAGSTGNTSGTTGGGTGGSSAGGSSAPTAGSSGSSAAVDCTALQLPASMDDVVSTFEDGTGNVVQTAERGGGFYMYNDGTGMQMPPPGALPDATAVTRCSSMFALCMKGSDFTIWGAGMGTDLGRTATGDGGTMAKTSYDASMYTGISFWAKANPGSALALRVSMKDANTAPEGGICDATMESGAEACNDDWGKNITLTTEWAPYTVLYSELRQSMWGKQFPAFDKAAAYSIQFQVNKNLDFDLCIDDLAFVR